MLKSDLTAAALDLSSAELLATSSGLGQINGRSDVETRRRLHLVLDLTNQLIEGVDVLCELDSLVEVLEGLEGGCELGHIIFFLVEDPAPCGASSGDTLKSKGPISGL